jgi:hypothetical protein
MEKNPDTGKTTLIRYTAFTMSFRTECEEKLLQMREEVDPVLWAM